ncbi:ANTAR domain-containing protein [Streptomyces kunmingensis]|uniref:ANTAR domain-containing protein n=1 Tax=Streptomyces kunmingensis TaxID=68225 RepID=A0ABU6C500_9ACTN|nr:ANTAR domain-containing protein [Streptomyces kunmingensis]MEB3958880.1 ANTAR domain-containing protein [Streptomyces kunmingensis]
MSSSGGVTVQELLDGMDTAASEEQRRMWAVNCAHALGLDGVAVSVQGELLWFSDQTSARLEDVQAVLGQGPGLLFPAGEGVREVPDVDRLMMRFWPQFVPEAQELGVAAVFVWPVRIGAVQTGTLTGYRRTEGALSEQQRAEGWLVADTLAAHMLSRWPDSPAAQDGPGHAGAVDLHRAEVHQATGVLSGKLDISLPEALVRLRAEAYSTGRTLMATAHIILERELPA